MTYDIMRDKLVIISDTKNVTIRISDIEFIESGIKDKQHDSTIFHLKSGIVLTFTVPYFEMQKIFARYETL